MCSGSWPNLNAWLQNAWSAGSEYQSTWPGNLFQGATNLTWGCNPPYTLDDFWQVYPKFFGMSTPIANCTVTAGSRTVVVPTVNGLVPGQYVQGWGVLAPGSVIVSINYVASAVTLNLPAAAPASNYTLAVYQGAPLPVSVIQLYLNLAWASLQQARWQEQWPIALSLFIAHYCTIYAQTDASEILNTLQTAVHQETAVAADSTGINFTLSAAPPGGALQSLAVNGAFLTPGVDYTLAGNVLTLNAAAPSAPYATWPVQLQAFTSLPSTGASIAAQGLAGGIQTAKSVGDVSVSYQPLSALESWGAWNLTKYGQMLATMAAVIGSGPMVIW